MGADLLFDVAWKGTAILLVACASARALGRSSAAARHLLWSAALVAILLTPALALLGPVWRVEVLPAPVRVVEANHRGSPSMMLASQSSSVAMRSVARFVVREEQPTDNTSRHAMTWRALLMIVWAAGSSSGSHASLRACSGRDG